MAKATPELINGLRETAQRLSSGAKYEWGHMGSCNCGNLAQHLTDLSRDEIHNYAMRKYGDWTEQAFDYCDKSGMTLDFVISTMIQSGLELEDIKHLENLSDRDVLRRMPLEERNLKHNHRDDVVKYMLCWADLLEEQLLSKISIKSIKESPKKVETEKPVVLV
ncbi:MAG: hypothetical protein AAF363_15235 [Bacteroidota bacterium]